MSDWAIALWVILPVARFAFGMSDGLSEIALDEYGWYVTDHARDDAILRGPFEDATTAGAVRTEMERGTKYDNANLWIVPGSYFSEGG